MKFPIYLLAKFIQSGNVLLTEWYSIGPYPNGEGFAIFSKNALLMESSCANWLAEQLFDMYDISSSEIFWSMYQKVVLPHLGE